MVFECREMQDLSPTRSWKKKSKEREIMRKIEEGEGRFYGMYLGDGMGVFWAFPLCFLTIHDYKLFFDLLAL